MASENVRLKNEVNVATRDRKFPIMDIFSDCEIENLFEHEMITRLLICRDMGSQASAHADILSLIEFIKKGKYLEKKDQTFTHALTEAFVKIVKTSASTPEFLSFWLAQLIYLADWLNKEYMVGGKISVYGIDLATSKQTKLSTVPANNFWEDIYQVILKIFRRLYKLISKTLIPLYEPLIFQDRRTSLNVSVLTSTLTQHLSTYLQCFTKYFIYDIIILQFFHQVYRHMDVILFNHLICKDNITGQLGLNIKLALSEIEGWKLMNLKKYYFKDSTTAPILPFKEIATLKLISQASKLVVLDKTVVTDLKFLKEQFSSLNYNQIYTLLVKYVPDGLCPGEVSKELMARLIAHFNTDEVIVNEKLIYSIFVNA